MGALLDDRDSCVESLAKQPRGASSREPGPDDDDLQMRILLVGALSWNPERLRSLCERGHELWGLWSRSMPWEQGPYPATEGGIRSITLGDAARTIREEKIHCVYSLFQVYHPRLWGSASPGVEHDVWTLLRALLRERHRGAFDAPIVRHWGYDVHNLDLDVVRALDGHLFCNREKLDYWTAALRQGGCGLTVFENAEVVEFLDSDRPKLEFMNDRFGERLSDADGEIHTVCVGRPFDIDFLDAARNGIHVHVYGNSFTEAYETIARDLSTRAARANAGLLGRYLHVHESMQTVGADWPEVHRAKTAWVEEFSRYDAAWSYLGSPFAWAPLDDRAAIPNRLGTYLLAGLPVITDRRPGFFRYEELVRLGIEVEFTGDYGELRDRLATESRTGVKRQRALEQRHGYSFDATIDRLLGAFEAARAAYFAKPHEVRTRFDPDGAGRLVHLNISRNPRALALGLVRRLAPAGDRSTPQRLAALVGGIWQAGHRRLLPGRGRKLARHLRSLVERDT
jgi:hypothetical protein